MGRQDPLSMEANLGSQKSIFEAQVGLHFGRGIGGPWAPQSIVLEAQEPAQNQLTCEVPWASFFFYYCFALYIIAKTSTIKPDAISIGAMVNL